MAAQGLHDPQEHLSSDQSSTHAHTHTMMGKGGGHSTWSITVTKSACLSFIFKIYLNSSNHFQNAKKKKNYNFYNKIITFIMRVRKN